MPLLLRAYELWEQLAAGLRTRGVPDHRWTVHRPARLPDRRGQPARGARMVAAARDARRGGDPPPLPDVHPEQPATWRVYEAKAGFARPEMTVQAHLDLAARAGADPALRRGGPATGREDRRRRHGDDRDRHLHRRAAGDLPGRLGAEAVHRVRHSRSPIERQVLYWLDPIGGTAPFEDQPIFIDENASGEQIYGFPAIDGPDGGVKVAFFRKGRNARRRPSTGSCIRRRSTRCASASAELLPALDGPCVHSATCMYSNTPDEHFVIARHPDSANVTVACGFSGHGFKFVPVVGEILADLAMTGTTATPSDSSTPATGDHMTTMRSPATAASPLLATLGGDYYTSADDIRRRAGPHLREHVVLRGALRRSRRPGPVQEGPGRPRERAGGARPRRRAAGLPQRLPPPRCDAVHRARRARSSGTCSCPYHAWTYALDGKLVAAPNMASLTDADRRKHRPLPVRPGARSRCANGSATPGCAWPTTRRRSTTTSSARSPSGSATRAAIDHYGIDELSVGRRDRLRRGGQLEADRRELHGVLPLRHDPPRTHRGAARVRRRPGRAVLRRARRRVRPQRYRVSPSTAAPASTRCPVSPKIRTAGTTPSPSSRRCSSTWCPTTSSSTGCTRWRPTAPSSNATGCTPRDVVARGRDVSRSVELFHRVNEQDFDACERTQPAMSSRAYRNGGVLVPSEHHIAEFHEWVVSRRSDDAR